MQLLVIGRSKFLRRLHWCMDVWKLHEISQISINSFGNEISSRIWIKHFTGAGPLIPSRGSLRGVRGWQLSAQLRCVITTLADSRNVGDQHHYQLDRQIVLLSDQRILAAKSTVVCARSRSSMNFNNLSQKSSRKLFHYGGVHNILPMIVSWSMRPLVSWISCQSAGSWLGPFAEKRSRWFVR